MKKIGREYVSYTELEQPTKQDKNIISEEEVTSVIQEIGKEDEDEDIINADELTKENKTNNQTNIQFIDESRIGYTESISDNPELYSKIKEHIQKIFPKLDINTK